MRPSPLLSRAKAARLPLALLLLGGVAACAPVQPNSTYGGYAVGRTQTVEYGTIIAERPVTVQGGPNGVGTFAGAAAGGVAGSFIGGDPRSHVLGALGGALIGGLVGTAVERNATTGQAVEFIIRTAQGDIAVVQSNEEGLQVGENVRILRGDRTRISRDASGNAPPPVAGYAPAPGGYPSAPQGSYQTPPPVGYSTTPQSGYQTAPQGSYQAAPSSYQAAPGYPPPPPGYQPVYPDQSGYMSPEGPVRY